MEKVILKARMREGLGKSASKHLRKEDRIPGVVYKGGKVGLNLSFDTTDLWHALHTEAGENAIITLSVEGDKKVKKTVILQDIQQDPLNDKFIHVDFHEISLKEKIQVNVPVNVKGEPVGVREEDGVLSQMAWELEVECLPTDIPESIDVKVDELAINDAIHVKDLAAIPGVTFLNDPEDMVVHVVPPQEEEIPEEGEGEELEEGAEPEVIKRGKEEEEESEEEGEEASSEEE
ncbi:MAG: 50S ribosomal protein L25 [Candidatus Omnitrophica bacterium]|nr:50S ribosomal protein L25 [Candidatus Omnitrophota bacterium]